MMASTLSLESLKHLDQRGYVMHSVKHLSKLLGGGKQRLV